jgi:hypothetical protein
MSRSGVTHYDVLRVSRRATRDEIRRAYRREAREAHPDRHGDGSAARMAAVNEAWRVLGDDDRRRAYDAALAEPVSPTTPPTTPPERPAPPPPTGELSRFPWRFFAVLFVLAVIVVLANAALTDPAPPQPVDDLLQPGDCVVADAAVPDEVSEVSCLQPHDSTVVSIVGFDGSCPTGTERAREPLGRGWVCLAPVTG